MTTITSKQFIPVAMTFGEAIVEYYSMYCKQYVATAKAPGTGLLVVKQDGTITVRTHYGSYPELTSCDEENLRDLVAQMKEDAKEQKIHFCFM